jgi:hypothetical protein
MASSYTLPDTSKLTVAATNTTGSSLQNNTSVFPRPLQLPNTSSAEYRIWLGFFIFGAVSAACIVIFMLVICAMSSGIGSHLHGKKRQSKDEQMEYEMSDREVHERVREPERVVLPYRRAK